MDGLTEDPEDGGASAGQPEHREGHGSGQTQLVGGVELPAWRTAEHTLLSHGRSETVTFTRVAGCHTAP